MNHILNTAIIGFGLSGRVFHAPFISELDEFKLSKILTRNEGSKNYIAKHYEGTEVVKDLELILNDQTIDLVIITTPNKLHYSFAKQALKSGKHVLIEKPFTVTTDEADDLIRLSKEYNRILTVFQNRRYDSDFKTVKHIIEQGLLGKLVEYEVHFDRFRNHLKPNAWKEKDEPGAGILYDLGPHLIDQALVLFGEPQKIFADVRKQRSCSDVDDYFEIILYYDRLKVTLKAGMLVKESLPKYILLGENGSFVKYGMDIQERDLRDGKVPKNSTNWGQEPVSIHGTINTELNGLAVRGKVTSLAGDYRDYFKDVYNAINKNCEPYVTPLQARTTIKIIELAIKSSEEGKTFNL
ncbi:Gfo/Idh/MocA family oxidoreductase [Haloplasma contractile]|uniref:Precorrin-2-cobalt-factor-2 C20-methyltransferase protein n=1 Tax=Haloplasma contractile SSD-17B TaxID=1033810 RepID=U2EDN3_9MOLU|nr:Gfo/Idh/MocA family oxidoreductase [Haloplasma contractile]ERJ13093.1 precorrin-2-cobalt-factor-2 C20-methyltransferase protein [Haloplasma contractile SSD-17B]